MPASKATDRRFRNSFGSCLKIPPIRAHPSPIADACRSVRPKRRDGMSAVPDVNRGRLGQCYRVALQSDGFSHKENCVVVVGSGPAGAAAALSLIEKGVDVTLIEAGPERAAFGLTARVAGVTLTRIHRP